MDLRPHQISLIILVSTIIPAHGQMTSSSTSARTPFNGSEDLYIMQNGTLKDTTLSTLWGNIVPPATATDSFDASISIDRGILTAISQPGTPAQRIFNQAV